jgi:hypothetical protein
MHVGQSEPHHRKRILRTASHQAQRTEGQNQKHSGGNSDPEK